jgi:flavin reductase (DIM6/NTAB) family NADH-FMN oxidoreductase RutF
MTSFDKAAFRRTLGRFPTGVCVVTANVEGRLLGMTMSSFNSLSLEPALVLFSVDRKANGLPSWCAASHYLIHVLAEDQFELSNRFARPGSKWDGLDYQPGYGLAPKLADVAATFECDAYRQIAAGDHVLFIARVCNFSADHARAPLVFAGGTYASLAVEQKNVARQQ